MKSDGPLTPKQTTALAALLAGKSAEAAAREAGVDPKTVRKWMRKDRRFVAEFRRAQKMVLDQASALLVKMTGKFIVVMIRTAESENEALAYKAASENFDRVKAVVQTEEFRRRLEALESRKKRTRGR